MPCSRVRDVVLQSVLAPANSRRWLSHETERRRIIELTSWTGGSWGRPPRLAKTTAGLLGQVLSQGRPVLGYFKPGRCNLFARTAHVLQDLRKASACPRFATRLQFAKGLVARFAKGSGSPKVRANVFGAMYSDKVFPGELVALSRSSIGTPAQKEDDLVGDQEFGRAVL